MSPYFLNGYQSIGRIYKGHKNLFLAHKYKFDQAQLDHRWTGLSPHPILQRQVGINFLSPLIVD